MKYYLLIAYILLFLAEARIQKNIELSNLFTSMWKKDVNRLEPNKDWVVDEQGYHKYKPPSLDMATKPFFKWVNEKKLQTPTFKSFIALLDNYDAYVGRNEAKDRQKDDEINEFLKSVMRTKVFQMAKDYLVGKNLLPESQSEIMKELKRIWFSNYGRGNSRDSSGFEHVFVGEIKYDRILGMHNWIQMYLEEKEGNLDYLGYLKRSCYKNYRIYTTVTRWHGGSVKEAGTILIGVSPEYEFSVLTTAFFVLKDINRRNTGKWAPLGVQLDPCFTLIQCHENKKGQIGTCYFT